MSTCAIVGGHTGDGALHLDGGCVQTMLPAEPSQFTIAFWANPSMLKNSTLVSRKYTSAGSHFSWQIFMGGAGGQSLAFTMYDGGTSDTIKLTGSTDFAVGQWHHYAVAFDGTNKLLYVDGALNTLQNAMGVQYVGNAVYIGCDQDLSLPTFVGDLDELRIYDTALSESAIMALASQ